MTRASILIAGVGNIFLGDDGFGSVVAGRLAERALPHHVRVEDFGIRGVDLAFALSDPYELVVLVDVVQRNSAPGTVHVLEVGAEPGALRRVMADSHAMAPVRALEMARALGQPLPRIVLVGCEPASFGDPDEGQLGLSAPVTHAIDPAIAAIEFLIAGHPVPFAPCTSLA